MCLLPVVTEGTRSMAGYLKDNWVASPFSVHTVNVETRMKHLFILLFEDKRFFFFFLHPTTHTHTHTFVPDKKLQSTAV